MTYSDARGVKLLNQPLLDWAKLGGVSLWNDRVLDGLLAYCQLKRFLF